jgi:hypothetical protein
MMEECGEGFLAPIDPDINHNGWESWHRFLESPDLYEQQDSRI